MEPGKILIITMVAVVLLLFAGYVGYLAWAMPKPNEYLNDKANRREKLFKLFLYFVKLPLYFIGGGYVERKLREQLRKLKVTE